MVWRCTFGEDQHLVSHNNCRQYKLVYSDLYTCSLDLQAPQSNAICIYTPQSIVIIQKVAFTLVLGPPKTVSLFLTRTIGDISRPPLCKLMHPIKKTSIRVLITVMISLQLLWCGRRLQSGRLCPSRFLLILEKITHPALFSTTLSLKLKTNDSVAMTTFCAIVNNYVTHYWGEGSLKVILLRMRMKSRPFPACAISGKWSLCSFLFCSSLWLLLKNQNAVVRMVI